MVSDDQKLQQAKEKLRQPLEYLKTISSSLASFTLQWQDLELFFKSIQKSIETLESEPNQIKTSDQLSTLFNKQYDWFVDPRSATKKFCVDMDGKGLMSYLIENPKKRKGIASALLFAPDPALLVLDALLGSFRNVDMRKTCVHLLEELMKVSSLTIRIEVMEEARKLAMEWKEKISRSSSSSSSGANCVKNYWEVLGWLLLLAVYRLGSDFNANGELLHLLEIINARRYHNVFDLCKIFGFEDKLSDFTKEKEDKLFEFVEDLIRKREHIEAINSIYKFGLVDKFPPVYKLLKERFRDGKKEAKEICEKGNDSLESRYEAIDRQIDVVRDVIRCVENHKIECKYNSENLRMRIRQLISDKKDLRHNAGISASASQWQHQSGSKRRPSLEEEVSPNNVKQQTLAAEGDSKNVKRQCLAAEADPKNVSSDPPVIHPIQWLEWNEKDACTSQNSQHLNSNVGSNGLAGFASATNPYSSSSGEQLGFNGIYAGSGANMNPGKLHLAGNQTSKVVSGLAGGLFNKNKKKIVGLVGSVAGIHKHGTGAS